MAGLLDSLTQMVEGEPLVALAAAFTWGILSIILSPCHLAGIPLIVGFISGQGSAVTVRRSIALSAIFAFGILITIGAIGLVTAAAGRLLGDVGPYGNYVVAVIFLLVGLNLLGIVPLPWSSRGDVGTQRKGAAAALLLGLTFGVAVGPCTFAFMAPMLGVTFTLADTHMIYGVCLLAAYAFGHCAVIVLAGSSLALAQRYLRWTTRSQGVAVLRGICGVLVILGGFYLLYTAP